MKLIENIKSALTTIAAYLFVFACYMMIVVACFIPVLVIFALVKYLLN